MTETQKIIYLSEYMLFALKGKSSLCTLNTDTDYFLNTTNHLSHLHI